MNRITSFLLLLTLSVVWGCEDVKKSEEYQTLAAHNVALQDSIQQMQNEVNEITQSMNQIENNLVVLRRDEMQIEDMQAEKGTTKNDRIFLILAEMDAYMEENKSIIKKLDNQLAKSRHANQGLRRLVALQKQAILEKEATIEELNLSMTKLKQEFTTTVAAKNEIISRQEAQLTNQQKNLEEKETTLQTGFILYGDRKQLFEKGVLQTEGGLLGKNLKLTTKLETKHFAPVNIKSVQEINIGVTNRQKALTIHPGDSYYFVKTAGITYLKITDPSRFWSVSKYLVIVIEG
jgi:hypothetical protein